MLRPSLGCTMNIERVLLGECDHAGSRPAPSGLEPGGECSQATPAVLCVEEGSSSIGVPSFGPAGTSMRMIFRTGTPERKLFRARRNVVERRRFAGKWSPGTPICPTLLVNLSPREDTPQSGISGTSSAGDLQGHCPGEC